MFDRSRQLFETTSTFAPRKRYRNSPIPSSQFAAMIVVCSIALVSLNGCGDAEPAKPSSADLKTDSTSPSSNQSTAKPDKRTEKKQSRNFAQPSDPKIDSRSDQEPRRQGQNQPTQKNKPIVYRPTYPQPDHNPQRIEALGFRQLQTTHVELITDVSPEKSAPLLPAVEQLHPFLVKYFGDLPPARNGAKYKVTGYLMLDRDKFFASGLAKEKQVGSFHGRQIGAEFWLNNQTLDYYRRHLLLHEIVHCYMRHLPNNSGLPPWYLEGMAELIATHRETDGRVEFSVMPQIRSRYSGLERIIIIQRDVKRRGIRSLGEITNFSVKEFQDVEAYAWSWALCRFLDSHQRYRKSFQALAKNLSKVQFRSTLNAIYADRSDQFATEWALFANNIVHGYDFDRSAITFVKGMPLAATTMVSVDSSKGWQSSAIQVEKGESYVVKGRGVFSVAQEPKPWISEANGVSIRYVRSRPIGQLLGAIRSDETSGPETMLKDFALGNDVQFTAPFSGTLYFRINDHWGELADNKGSIEVSVAR
jgi:hypothetical protein